MSFTLIAAAVDAPVAVATCRRALRAGNDDDDDGSSGDDDDDYDAARRMRDGCADALKT